MKRSLSIIFLSAALLLCNTFKAGAQDADKQLSSLCLSVVLPENIDGLSESQLSKIESKIIQAAANNGVSADGYTQNFVIYPKFEIYDEKATKGGMRSVTVVDCNINLFIKQLSTNMIFSSYSKSLQGSGSNKNEALNNAISQINAEDEKLNSFIQKGKDKIIAYYQANCAAVLQKADGERSRKNFDASLAMLLTVPVEAKSCYTQAQAKAKTVFAEFQKASCAQYIQNARSYAAAADYESALQAIRYVNAGGPCAGDAKKVIASVSSKVDAERKKEWDFLLTAYSNEVALEKANIQAMNNLAVAWLTSQPAVVSYTTVIK